MILDIKLTHIIGVFCKENLYSTIKLNLDGTIFSGANVDDLNDFRPGLDAAKNANVLHPFVDNGFTKKYSKISERNWS